MDWIQPLLLTLQLIAVSIAIAAVLGIVGAWAASSLGHGGRNARWISRFFFVCMVLAIALPMILHAAAWEATAGKFGWMIMTQTGSRAMGTGTYGFFRGLVACGWIHGLMGAAIVALTTWKGTSETPAQAIQQSRLQRGPLATWWRIQLPIAAPWVLTGLLCTALLAATEMTVVDLYGYRTLADEFYLFYAIDPSIPSVLMTCCLPLAIALALGASLLRLRRRKNLATRSPGSESIVSAEPLVGFPKWLAVSVALSVASLIVLVPIVGLVIKVGHQVDVTDGAVTANWSAVACLQRLVSAPRTFAQEYGWTALLGGVAGATATLLALPVAAVGRTHRWLERWFDIWSVVLITIPGPVVGLIVVTLFQWPAPGFSFLYQQTIFPTVLAVLVRSLPVAYWILRAAYRSIADETFDAARLDGSWQWRIWHVDLPLLKRGLIATWIAAGIVASGDVPAMLPVIPPGMTTVGTRLFGLLHSGARYQEAALAIWYLAAVVVIAVLFARQSSAAHGKL